MTLAAGVGPAGVVGVAVAAGSCFVDPGLGVSSPGTGVLAPADRMVGAGAASIPREHATMATLANKMSRAPGRDLIRITMALSRPHEVMKVRSCLSDGSWTCREYPPSRPIVGAGSESGKTRGAARPCGGWTGYFRDDVMVMEAYGKRAT